MKTFLLFSSYKLFLYFKLERENDFFAAECMLPSLTLEIFCQTQQKEVKLDFFPVAPYVI